MPIEEFRDQNGHLVAKGDPESGNIESAYKKQVIRTRLHVGGSISIEQSGVITIIIESTGPSSLS